MTMTQQEFDKWESDLEKAGYRKGETYTDRCNEEKAFSWTKERKDEDGEWLVLIEWRIWDWRPYMWQFPHLKGDPFSLSLVVHISSRLNPRMDCSCPDSVEEGELIAQRFYEYSESVKKEIKNNKSTEQ